MLKDLRHAARVLLQNKAWTAVVVVSLALGIGANTALFSAVNALLLEEVPVPEPASLVRLKWAGQNDMTRGTSDYGWSRPAEGGQRVVSTFSYDIYLKLRAANKTLIDLAACAPAPDMNVIVDGAADFATAFAASGNYFTLLKVRPYLGRVLQEADDRPTAPPAAVISHRFWVRRFGSDPKIEGRTISVNNTPMTIVGVLPPEFTGIQRPVDTIPDITVPVAFEPALSLGRSRLAQATSYWLQVIGRLKPGATVEQVRGNLEGVFHEAARAGMDAYQASLTDAQRGLSNNQRRGSTVPPLIVSSASHGIYDPENDSTQSAGMLTGVVVLVLLIVCANVANLMLSRSAERRKEVSVRLSMGATRGRLIRQLLTESLLLAGMGGLLGGLIGYWCRALIPFGENAPMDWRILLFTAVVSLTAGVAFGLVPAFRATRVDLAGVMKETSRSVVSSRTLLARGLLVVQVAVSVVLLVGAGLFLRTLHNLRQVDVGFNPANVLMFRVNPILNGYSEDRTRQVFRELRNALIAVPGVRAASFTAPPLLTGGRSSTGIYLQGETQMREVFVLSVSPEFFDTMEIPFLAGHTFGDQDARPSSTMVINDAAARKLFPDGNVLGRRLGGSPEQNSETEIIGVVRDAMYYTVREAPPPTIYRSYLQNPPRAMYGILRTATDPVSRIDAIREAVHKVDANLPIAAIATQTEQIERRFAQERLFATAYSWFGGLALIVAAIGLFGLMSYSVSRRTSEIGVRMALGANRSDVTGMVLRESMLLVAIGVVLGCCAALSASSLVERTLFGVAPRDTVTMALAVAVMTLVALAAAYLPARRASRVDPMVALRYE